MTLLDLKIMAAALQNTRRMLKNVTKNIVFVLLSLTWANISKADIPLDAPDWKEVAKEGDISIYTRNHEGSSFQAFKAVAVLNAPFPNVMAVMANPLSCLEWVHGCSKVYGFDENHFGDRFAYSVNDLPWPFKDRDYILKLNATRDPATGTIRMHMVADKTKMPVNNDFVRVDIAETVYLISPAGPEKTRLIWLQHTDPGGVLPGWLVNSLIVDIPMKSLQRLEEVAHEPKYQNAELIYDDQGQIKAIKAPFQTQPAP